ncbi:protein-methionine-sulfoxide reductase heme-binding subunit MsrQ [Rhizobium sp. BK251]|uniref:protein-methionine-sulfoxide reductase heme-binding subunit MsrQ n=1 Tax=Rhizobium sp. BK251 TaxID=2512125 RepID=UPI00105066BB|nr:protein-methionine-sulfoxide reductase heme-binding subunit MsrQ [Rhizobium sp. BK251]TCL67128.1 sulfoxide reductase heme-binding subunit YedZ [Rhizobium sp. BK251]
MPAISLSLPKRWQPASVWLLYAVGFIPAVWQFYLGATGNLGADPVKTFELFLGLWTIRFLILTLAVSPLRELAGWNLIRYRRALGLLTFYYALMHFSVYMILDQALYLQAVIADVAKRPFIMFGMAGLVFLVPLAITSNMFSIRRLGKNWVRLHKLIYLVAALGAVHFSLATKVLSVEQYIYIGLITLLLLYRLVRPVLRNRKRDRAERRQPNVSPPRVAG